MIVQMGTVGPDGTRRRGQKVGAAALLALVMVGSAGLVACSDRGDSAGRPDADPAAPADPPELSITPDEGTTGATLSTEIGTETTGDVTSVTLATADGAEVSGEMRADGTAWVPDQPLAPETGYAATVSATGDGGQVTTATTGFTTMAAPASRTETGLYMFDEREYGVGMPVVVEFVHPVPEEARPGVQRRMFVTTDPPQPGVWHWVPNGRQAFYRAPEYWQPGTTISVRIALDGHPTGEDRYGDADRTATVTIGRRLEMEIDNAAKELTVLRDGEEVRTMPVSLGKPSTPSSYGRMVVMSRERETVFDTLDELGPDEGYRIDISYAMRLTWGGEYIHSAPWSVADQGVRNVSHGCVNLAPDDARWLFEQALVGDPVTVRGTEEPLAHGNGWTAWNLDWDEFVAGSALPVPADLAAAGDPPANGSTPS